MSRQPIVPTEAGKIRFYESVKESLEREYGLVVTATVTEFEIRRKSDDKVVGRGDTIQWLQGFVYGISATSA